jgi:hypothetical protein
MNLNDNPPQDLRQVRNNIVDVAGLLVDIPQINERVSAEFEERRKVPWNWSFRDLGLKFVQ